LPFTKTAAPVISGGNSVGSTVKATTGSWSPTATVTYQWYRNGVAIVGATKSVHVVAASEEGTVLTVKATGKRSGYTTTVRTSAQWGIPA
jgi:hypothetical protein